jgi:oligoribonuclease (3'-5' exoribonuclease)
MSEGRDALLWLDIETTGLDYQNDDIMEIAWAITTMRGDLLPYSGYYLCQPDCNKLSDFTLKMHTDNGLVHDLHVDHFPRWGVKGAGRHIEARIAAAKGHNQFQNIHLAGASVHFDRTFLATKGVNLDGLTHRHVDLSSLKLALAATGRAAQKRTPRHRAWWDVMDEIDEYRTLLSMIGGR